jgi:hypothetical protein
MKEKNIIKNLLTFLKPYERYILTEEEPGVYKLENIVILNLPNIDFAQFTRRNVTINLNNDSVSYDLSGYGSNNRYTDSLNLNDHAATIIEQLSKRAKLQLDYNIRCEDSDRLRKSRECRVNRQLMSLKEVT